MFSMFRNTITIKSLSRFDILTERENLPMNETEFEYFYNEHSRPLWAYVRRLADSAEIADDVMQESFLKFLGATLRTDENKKAYLYRIATNLVYDYFRRHKRESKHQMSVEEKGEPAYEPFLEDSGFTKILDKLKTQERALLWLAYVEGHQHDEIAQMLGLRALSVRVLLFRAKQKLTKLLDENNFEVGK